MGRETPLEGDLGVEERVLNEAHNVSRLSLRLEAIVLIVDGVSVSIVGDSYDVVAKSYASAGRLGAPVVEVNVDLSQAEDCIDDALKLFADYHYNGSLKTILRYQITAADITNQYIPIPDHILGVVRVIPFSLSYGAQGTLSEAHYQLLLSDIFSYMGGDIISYDMSMRHLTLLNNILNLLS